MQVQLLGPGHLEEDYPSTTFSKTKDFKVLFSRTNNIHESDGCFLRGQVSSSSFKVFNGCIVDP